MNDGEGEGAGEGEKEMKKKNKTKTVKDETELAESPELERKQTDRGKTSNRGGDLFLTAALSPSL